MKLKKYITALAASLAGAGVIATAPAYADGHTGYSQSLSGKVRVQAITRGQDHNPLRLTTGFGGRAEESTTGDDTYLQWEHNFVGENSQASGFLRFASDADLRINVEGSSELNNFRGELKAEWELGLGGDEVDVRNRDQFVKLIHTGTGLFYKIGREEWLGGQKGYATDFNSYTKGYADLDFGSERFSAHQLGWSGSGVTIAALLQRDDTRAATGNPYGIDYDLLGVADGPGNAGTVETYGLQFAYAGGPLDLAYMVGYGVVNPWSARPTRILSMDSTRNQFSSTAFITELQLALEFGKDRPLGFTPFFNFGFQSINDRLETDRTTLDPVSRRTELEYDAGQQRFDNSWGLNAGLAFSFGDTSDLVIAGGALGRTITGLPEATIRGGVDVMWATKADPLNVALQAGYSAGTNGNPRLPNTAAGNFNETQDYRFGVRLEFGF